MNYRKHKYLPLIKDVIPPPSFWRYGSKYTSGDGYLFQHLWDAGAGLGANSDLIGSGKQGNKL